MPKQNMDSSVRAKIYEAGDRKIDAQSIDVLTKYVDSLSQTKASNTKRDGTYTVKRKALHKRIISKFKKKLICIERKQPIAILMGGSPASGKSTFLNKYAPYLLKEELLRIDADEVRAQLPEYDGWNAAQTHLETKDIVAQLLSDKTIGVPCKFDVVFDGTMNNTASYTPLINLLHDLGYKIFVVYINKVDKAVITERALGRYQRSGRFVPLTVIDDFFSKGKTALNEIKTKADGYMILDGSDEFKIIEQGGMKLPKTRQYSRIGHSIESPTKNKSSMAPATKKFTAAQIKDLTKDSVLKMSDKELIQVGKVIAKEQSKLTGVDTKLLPKMTISLAKAIVNRHLAQPKEYKKGGKVGWWRDHYYQSEEPHEKSYAKRKGLVRERYAEKGAKVPKHDQAEDMKYLSDEPWEQAYKDKRKRSYKEKKKGGTITPSGNFTHFAIHKPTGKIINAWNYKGVSEEDLHKNKKLYFFDDLKQDFKINSKDATIISKQTLVRRKLDPKNIDNWYNPKMGLGGFIFGSLFGGYVGYKIGKSQEKSDNVMETEKKIASAINSKMKARIAAYKEKKAAKA